MTLRNKNLQDLGAQDLVNLVTQAVEEGTQLDFKSALVGGTNDDRKKFLADICAFANAHGGDLVLGVQETAVDKVGRSALVLPDVLLRAWPADNLAEYFRSRFDRLWQTSGYVRSSGYPMRNRTMAWQGHL